jgi:signal transduction histidine kinase/ActR/RegA family two-component response regulator
MDGSTDTGSDRGRAPADSEASLDRLAAFAQAVGTARDLPTIFAALRDFARDAVPCMGIFISLYDPAKDHRVAMYGWADGVDLDVSGLPAIPVTDGPNSVAVRTGDVVITNDDDRGRKGGPNIVVETGRDSRIPQSSLVAPMAVMGRIVGTVEVQSYDRGAYDREHAATLRFASTLAAVAIENFRLLEGETTARALAEESSRLKDEFLATLSHELRTPLNAIVGWTSMLRTGRLDAGAADRALEAVARNARAQAQLVEDLLDVSRIITGKLRLDVEPVAMRDVVEAAVDSVRPAADAKGVSLRLVIESAGGTVAGDARRLQQAVWNMLTNAVKFTPSGGRVELTLSTSGERVEVLVTDTGCGIEPAFLPHIFDRFRQADSSTTRAHGGLGLGLSIVAHLMELHGGTVEAESEGVGRGATFALRLPLLRAAAGLRTAARPDAATDDAALAGLRVLLVDDDVETLEILTLALSALGAEVRRATSAAGGLEEFEREAPDVLVSDIGMPGGDGFGLVASVRALPPERGGAVPAIALTAYAGTGDGARALAAGFDARLVKPADLAELTATVLRLSRSARDGGGPDRVIDRL